MVAFFKSIKACFCVCEHQKNSEVSKHHPSEHCISSLEKHDSDKCNLQSYSRNLVVLQYLTLDLGLLLLLRNVFEILAWSRLLLGTQWWIPAALLAKFCSFYIRIQILCLFFECSPILIWTFLREFQMVASVSDLPYPLLTDHQSNFPPRLRRSPWTFQEGFLCRSDALDLGSEQKNRSILLLPQK